MGGQEAVSMGTAGATLGAELGGGWGAAAGGLIGGGIGLFGGGGGSSQSGYTLPPEYELQYLQQFSDWMDQSQQAYQQSQQAYDSYDQKINSLNNIISTGYNAQDFQKIQQSNFSLGQALGMSAQDLVKNGFITNEDQVNLTKMEQLASGDWQKVNNPVLEGQLSNQKRQLEQDLARSGVSPQQRAIALAQFDQSSNEQRYQQNSAFAQQQFGMLGGVIGQRAGLRQQGFGQATNTLGIGMQQAGQYMGAYGQLGANYGAQYGASNQMQQMQAGLRGEQQGLYTTMGQFKLSSTTNNFLAGGGGQQWGGPNSYGNQTGVPKQDTGNYKRWVQKQQEQMFKSGQDIRGKNFSGQDYSKYLQAEQARKQAEDTANRAKMQAYYSKNAGYGSLAGMSINRSFVRG